MQLWDCVENRPATVDDLFRELEVLTNDGVSIRFPLSGGRNELESLVSQLKARWSEVWAERFVVVESAAERQRDAMLAECAKLLENGCDSNDLMAIAATVIRDAAKAAERKGA